MMAIFRFPVSGRGPLGVEVHADLLSEAWVKIRAAIPGVDALLQGAPRRIDAQMPANQGVPIGRVIATERGV